MADFGIILLIFIFIVGVVLAFPLAAGTCATLGAPLFALDWLGEHCPGFTHLRRLYRSGRLVIRFIAPNIRRDVEVLDASRVYDGLLLVRQRTWNVLYASHGEGRSRRSASLKRSPSTNCGCEPAAPGAGRCRRSSVESKRTRFRFWSHSIPGTCSNPLTQTNKLHLWPILCQTSISFTGRPMSSRSRRRTPRESAARPERQRDREHVSHGLGSCASSRRSRDSRAGHAQSRRPRQ